MKIGMTSLIAVGVVTVCLSIFPVGCADQGERAAEEPTEATEATEAIEEPEAEQAAEAMKGDDVGTEEQAREEKLAWAEEWLTAFSSGKLETVMAMYDDGVDFEDVTLAHKARGKTELAEFLRDFVEPTAGEHVFTLNGYSGGAAGGAVEWTWNAKHGGEFLGVAAEGKETTVRGVSVIAFKDGKILSQRDYWDAGAVLRQLGAIK